MVASQFEYACATHSLHGCISVLLRRKVGHDAGPEVRRVVNDKILRPLMEELDISVYQLQKAR